ncbi:MAG: hypothetical protein MZV49_10500 [Rhodopseudomonas palustris]|nr:hypothetical protein [Rhodopseudomonas palustris]
MEFNAAARAARSGAPAARPTAQSAATLNLLRAFAQGGYRRPAPACIAGTWASSQDSPLARALPGSWPTASPTTLDFMRGLRHHARRHAAAARDRVLHQPRGAAAAATSRR